MNIIFKKHSYSTVKKSLRNLIILLFFMPIMLFGQISLKSTDKPIRQIMKEIEKSSNYKFFYNSDLTALNKKKTLVANNQSIESTLKDLFKETPISWEIKNNNLIVLTLADTKSEKVSGNKKRITGTVSDAAGEPIIGANVTIQGTTTGTVTDIDGNYELEAPENSNLHFSYIGYQAQTVPLKGQTKLNMILPEDHKVLGEVVVVGYGTQKKVNLTGSVAAISTEDIKDRVQTNVLSAVQGTVPGVTIISRPGSTPSINFRGRGNLGASSPLYVIDGAIADASFFSNLDPNSIETISFLKDAASSAIYGSRAAYGVVLVTTKAGKKDKLNVSYNGYVAMKNPTYLPDLVNSWEYAELLNEAFYNRDPKNGSNKVYSAEQIAMFRDGSNPDMYPNTNWSDLVLNKNVPTTQHSLNFSGGSEKIKFFTGLGYLYDDNFLPGQKSDRYNLNTNVSADLTKWLTLKSGIKYIRNGSNRDRGGVALMNFLVVPSTMVARHSNGMWGSYAGGTNATQSFMQGNPLRNLDKNDWSNSKTENTMYDLGFDIKPIKGLTISGQGVFKGYEYKAKSYTALQDDIIDFKSGNPIPGTGIYINKMDMNWQSSNRMLYTGTARYELTKGDHDMGALVGTSYEHYKSEILRGSRKNFPTDDLEDMNGGSSAGEDITNAGGMSENKMSSYFSRVNYSYKSRYLAEANIRADGSSNFHKSNRWGVFPSFSTGWRMSEEAFMKDLTWVDNIKFRASWGTLGNINNVGNYDYFQGYGTSNGDYNFEDQAVIGIMENKPANKGLGWETVALTDFGIDIDLLNGKLGLVADYYIKKTGDILLAYNVPLETGITSKPSQNIGRVENKGFELALTHKNTYGDFSYSVSGNMSINKNKVTNLGGSDNIIQGGGDKINFILKEGESIGSFYGYKTDGLYTQAEIDKGEYYKFGRIPKAGDIKYVPQRADVPFKSEISGEDRTIIGKDVPDFTYGLNLNLMYKNFEFSLFGQGVSGTSAAFESEQVWAFFLNSNPRNFHMKRWTESNPNPRASYPRIYGGHSLDNYNQNFSDYQLFDADYFRIKNISLGYSLPAALLKNTGLSTLKLFLTGENLFTIRADKTMKDFDPEAASGRGLGAFGTKSVAFGVNVAF